MSRNTRPASPADTGGIGTKVDLLIGAFGMLRISGITRQPTPGDLEIGINTLEDMAAELESQNSGVGWNFEDEPDPNSWSGIKRCYWHAFKTNVAVRMIPFFGKTPAPALVAQASQAMSSLHTLAAAERMNQVEYPNRMARGSGNTNSHNRWARFYQQKVSAPNISNLRELFYGDVDDYVENFDSYLRDDEDIETFEIVADSGLEIEDQELVDNDILYRVKATTENESQASTVRQLTIIVTTDINRVTTRRNYWQLISRGTGDGV